jgi:hypothetical protein
MNRAQILARKRETLIQLCELQREEAGELWTHLQHPPRFASVVAGIWTFLKRHPGLLTAALAAGASTLGKRSRFAAKLIGIIPLVRTSLDMMQRFQRSTR